MRPVKSTLNPAPKKFLNKNGLFDDYFYLHIFMSFRPSPQRRARGEICMNAVLTRHLEWSE